MRIGYRDTDKIATFVANCRVQRLKEAESRGDGDVTVVFEGGHVRRG